MQTVAVVILLVVALLADGLMDTLGPTGFMLAAGPAVLAAGLLVCLSDRPRTREKAAPVLEHRDGQTQQVLTDAVDASIISENQEEKQV